MGQVEKYLNKMLEFEEKDEIDAALMIANKILETFPEYSEQILLELGKLEFRTEMYEEALSDLIRAYNVSGDEDIYNLILEAYLFPNQENLEAQYQENLKQLEQYPYYKNEYPQEELRFYPIFQSDEMVACVDTESRTFAMEYRKKIEQYPERDTCYMMFNGLWLEDILKCEEESRISEPFMDMNIPMYLVYDKLYWILFLQLYDYEQLIDKKRIVFLVGEEAFCEYLSDTQVIMPNRTRPEDAPNYWQILQKVAYQKEIDYQQNSEIVEHYYSGNKKMIDEHIKSGKPRILFLTSRFTTVLQYHTRDCMEAAKSLGCETELMIEPDGIRRVTNFYTMERLAEFQPDIIFCLDHFRYERLDIPPEIIYITWVQDPLPHIMDRETPGKLTDRDFVMSLYTEGELEAIGYPKEKLIDAPIPANHHVYKPYDLTEEEYRSYSCDICFVCHASDVDKHIEEELLKYPKELWDAIATVYKGYQEYVYQTGHIFYRLEELKEYIAGVLRQRYAIVLKENYLVYMAEDMRIGFNQRVYRQVLVDWLLDAGFTNIKLWGNGWADNPKYQLYAMGAAKNGETLSKIYQSSKVVLGNNFIVTSAARTWESMLSGAFYMCNHVPPEVDDTSIYKIMDTEADVVVFYSKEDLIEKLQYYLEHEEERQEMINRGRALALKKMTYDALMKRVIGTIEERLEE